MTMTYQPYLIHLRCSVSKFKKAKLSGQEISLAATRAADAQVRLGSVVEHQHQGSADTAERVGNEPLVQASSNALLRGDLLQAISGALVDVLLNWLLCLHLETPADSVEGIADASAHDDGCLCRRKRGGEAHHAGVVLPRVEAHDGVEGTELEATVRDDSSEGHAETSVEGKETLGACSRLLQAIEQTVEGLLSGANIRSKARSGVVQRIHDRQTACCCQTTRRHVHSEEHAEILLRAVLWEHFLDRILEGQIEGLRRKIPDAIREVASPEGRGALLAINSREAIPDARVARHLSAPDLRIGILGLNNQLDSLDGRGERLRNGTRNTSEEEIGGPIFERQLLLRHGVNTVTPLQQLRFVSPAL